jgi:hypothetical protein
MLSIASLVTVGTALAMASLDLISPLAFDLVFAAACGGAMTAFMNRFGAAGFAPVATMVLVIAGAVAARLSDGSVLLTPYLAIAQINGFVAYIFARGLLPGRDPLIFQVIRLTGSGPEGTDDFRRFVYGQSILWTLLGTATSLAGMAALLSPAWRHRADIAISGLLITQAAWFLLSHIYANRRYDRPETWRATLRTYSNASVWAKLDK